MSNQLQTFAPMQTSSSTGGYQMNAQLWHGTYSGRPVRPRPEKPVQPRDGDHQYHSTQPSNYALRDPRPEPPPKPWPRDPGNAKYHSDPNPRDPGKQEAMEHAVPLR
jgi:hypothetical protein